MELSPENLEDLAIAMSGNPGSIGTLDNVDFKNESDFSNLNMDEVPTSDPHQYLYSTPIEAVSGSCSFNDILDDICEMDKTMELNQTTANTINSSLPFSPVADLPMGYPAFFHMPDIGIQQADCPPETNFPNQTDFLHPLGQWPEYLSSLPPALDNLQEVPQLTTIPTPPPPESSSPALQAASSDVATINISPNLGELQLASPAPVVPLQFYNNCHFNFPAPTVPQSEPPGPNPQFLAPTDKNLNVAPKKHPRIQRQLPCFGWARVVPRKAFVQPTEIVVLRPLRTRKAASSRQTFDLSSYFDTSAISIPMIRERPRGKNANRRKQKLRTIPGAENMMFEVQLQPKVAGSADQIGESDTFTDANNNTGQLYPETEIPELDEIFKRKRRGLNTRRNPQPQDEIKVPKLPPPVEGEGPITTVQPLLDEKKFEVTESSSDMDSDDAPLTAVKSIKCQNCRKLFKTCRSLTIHSKRCEGVRRTPVKDILPDDETTGQQKAGQISGSKENIDSTGGEEKIQIGRPITRSQTNTAKRKASGYRDCVATKRKC